MDGDTQRIASECPIFVDGHKPNYDLSQSDANKSVWMCACGYQTEEVEDCGTGA